MPQRDFAFLALECGLAVLRADPDGSPGDDAKRFHVIGVHDQGVHDGLVLGVVLADVDLLALLAGPAGIHQETPARHAVGLVCSECTGTLTDHSDAFYDRCLPLARTGKRRFSNGQIDYPLLSAIRRVIAFSARRTDISRISCAPPRS